MDPTISIALALLACLVTALFFFLKGKSDSSPSSGAAADAAASSASGAASGAAADTAATSPAGPLTVFFGSQTGTAEGFAETIAQEGKKQGFATSVVDLDDFDENDFRNCGLAVCLLSTYGEGEPTDNAAQFVSWLKNSDGDMEEGSDGALQGLNFCVFGLGNTEYEQYNRVGKLVDEQLSKLGAARVFQLGLGDDSASLEEDFEGWKEALWPALVKQFHPDASSMSRSTSVADLAAPTLPFKVVTKRGGQSISDATAVPDDALASTKHYFTAIRAKVVENRELRSPSDGGSTRHVEVDIHNIKGLGYETADNLAVLPENDNASVERLANAMGWADMLDMPFVLEKNKQSGAPAFKKPFPTPCTVRTALASYCDIHGMPRRSTLKDWMPFVGSAAEREVLQGMVSKTGGREKYKAMVEDKHRSLLDILVADFPSTRVPLDHFLHVVPYLQPRYYTISSSSNVHPNRVHITVSVVDQAKPDGGVFRGVCSSFLQALEPPVTNGGGKRLDESGGRRGAWPSCRVFVRPSSFRLPKDPKTPIVMIGPGTGIAPMRALLQERGHQREKVGEGGENVLYFGCKNREKDFLYREELEAFQSSGVLTTLHLAFSRENPKKKVYVQHLMKERTNAAELWDLVHSRGAHIYVCGGTSMGTDVGKALAEVVSKLGGRDLAKSGAADNYVAKMKEEGRYVQELWS